MRGSHTACCALRPCPTEASLWADVHAAENMAEEDHEARNDFMKSIMWKSTDFLRLVVGEVESMGTTTSTCVSEYCHMFPVEDLLCWLVVGCCPISLIFESVWTPVQRFGHTRVRHEGNKICAVVQRRHLT